VTSQASREDTELLLALVALIAAVMIVVQVTPR